jgi:hypothetical protein
MGLFRAGTRRTLTRIHVGDGFTGVLKNANAGAGLAPALSNILFQRATARVAPIKDRMIFDFFNIPHELPLH